MRHLVGFPIRSPCILVQFISSGNDTQSKFNCRVKNFKTCNCLEPNLPQITRVKPTDRLHTSNKWCIQPIWAPDKCFKLAKLSVTIWVGCNSREQIVPHEEILLEIWKRLSTAWLTLPSLALNDCKAVKEEDLFHTSLLNRSKSTINKSKTNTQETPPESQSLSRV